MFGFVTVSKILCRQREQNFDFYFFLHYFLLILASVNFAEVYVHTSFLISWNTFNLYIR